MTNRLPEIPPAFDALNEVAAAVHENAINHGFYDNPETDDQLLSRNNNNLHQELSELWGAYRDGKLMEPCDKAEKMIQMGLPGLTNEEEECADILIRTFDYMKKRGLHPGRCVYVKHTYNKTRPYRHGDKLA